MTEQQTPMLRNKPVTDYSEHIQKLFARAVELLADARQAESKLAEAQADFNNKTAALKEVDSMLGNELNAEDKEVTDENKDK